MVVASDPSLTLAALAGCSSIPSEKYVATEPFEADAYQACVDTRGAEAKMSESPLASICKLQGSSGLAYARCLCASNLAEADFKACQKLALQEQDKCFADKRTPTTSGSSRGAHAPAMKYPVTECTIDSLGESGDGVLDRGRFAIGVGMG